jgi:hypothetical protein
MAPDVVLEIWLGPRLGVSRTRTAATPVAGFPAFVDYRIAHTSLGRCSSISWHSCDRRVRRDVKAALSPDNI